jgi:hypothetical protein
VRYERNYHVIKLGKRLYLRKIVGWMRLGKASERTAATFVHKGGHLSLQCCGSTEGCGWAECAVVTSNVTLEPTVCLLFIRLPLVVSLQIWNFPKTSRCSPSATCTICIMPFIDPNGRPFAGILIFWYNTNLLYFNILKQYTFIIL